MKRFPRLRRPLQGHFIQTRGGGGGSRSRNCVERLLNGASSGGFSGSGSRRQPERKHSLSPGAHRQKPRLLMGGRPGSYIEQESLGVGAGD